MYKKQENIIYNQEKLFPSTQHHFDLFNTFPFSFGQKYQADNKSEQVNARETVES